SELTVVPAALLLFASMLPLVVSAVIVVAARLDRKGTRLTSSDVGSSYAVVCWNETLTLPTEFTVTWSAAVVVPVRITLPAVVVVSRSEEHTSELLTRRDTVCRALLVMSTIEPLVVVAVV